MKTQPLVPRLGRNLKRMLTTIAVSSLIVVGVLWAGVLLPPLDAPAHVLSAPAAAAAPAPNAKGVTGTLASFAALFPEMANVYLPTVVR